MSSTVEEKRAQIPEWLTRSYLQKVLRNQTGAADLEVKSFTAEPPVAAGNNYASLILRANAQCLQGQKSFEKSLIIKTIHFDEKSAKMLEEYGVHETEMLMYSDILPKLQKLVDSIGGEKDLLAPEALCVDKETQAIILEDMKPLNYKIGDRMVGLDLEHMKIIARKHAKLHAASIVAVEQGANFTNFNRGIFNEHLHTFDPFIINLFKDVGEEVQKWAGFESYGQKLVKLTELVIQQGIDMYKINPHQLNVLNHADSWLANMMFKYDDRGRVLDAVLVSILL